MRAINTARLYASGHELLKKHIHELYTRLREAMGDRDLLFLGCARDEIFLEGSFSHAKQPHIQKSIRYFHFLRISHVLLEKEITVEEPGSFIELLASAGQGQKVHPVELPPLGGTPLGGFHRVKIKSL